MQVEFSRDQLFNTFASLFIRDFTLFVFYRRRVCRRAIVSLTIAHKMRLFTLLTLFLSGTSILLAANEPALVVKMTDGSSRYVRLDDAPSLSISSSALRIVSNTADIELPRAEVKSYSIGEFDFSGVEFAQADGPAIDCRGREIFISNLPAGESITVFDIEGRKIARATASPDGKAAFSLPAAGPVIVASKSINLKVLVK